jgi:hypothetical protein
MAVVSTLKDNMLTKEKIQNHIRHLREQHDTLDERITREHAAYGDDYVVKRLKKEKLEINDEIERMRLKLNDCTE